MDLFNDRNWSPMLLKEQQKPFDSKDYIFELKFDGIRALLFVTPKEVKVYNRRKKDISYLFPELKNIKKLVKKNTIFDGEIIIMENGVPSFNKIQNRVHIKNKNKIKYQSENNPVLFICFDILYNNKNLITLPLIDRKNILNNYDDNDYFFKSKYIENNGINMYKNVKKINLEGIVAKKKDSIYEINKRTDNWLKIKNFKKEEFFIGGYIEKESNYIISLVLGEYKNDKLYYIGKVTLSKKTNLYKRIKKERIINKSPFSNLSDKKINYINPKLKCYVKYMERTRTEHLRQPFIN